MNPHLTPDELVDALEGALAAPRQAHVTACAACRAQVDELTATLATARLVEVPEPSPLFFDHLSERVAQAIDAAETAPAPARSIRWFQWPVLAPMGALALLVLTLISGLPRTAPTIGPEGEIAGEAGAIDPATAADDGWDLLDELLADVDLETVRDAGVAAAPGSAERALAALTADEREELVRLLEEELKESGG